MDAHVVDITAESQNNAYTETVNGETQDIKVGITQDDPNAHDQSGQTIDGPELIPGAIGLASKTPNSYKYPLLKKYFEFGPWVGRNRKALCLACQVQSSSSQPDRLLKHLMRCASLSETDKVAVADLMNERTANKRKRPGNLRLRSGGDHDDSEYYVDDDPNNTGEGLLPSGTFKKTKRDPNDRNAHIDDALTRWIMVCRIPLKAIHSREFVDFVRALNTDYQIPSRETITNHLIPGMLNIL